MPPLTSPPPSPPPPPPPLMKGVMFMGSRGSIWFSASASVTWRCAFSFSSPLYLPFFASQVVVVLAAVRGGAGGGPPCFFFAREPRREDETDATDATDEYDEDGDAPALGPNEPCFVAFAGRRPVEAELHDILPGTEGRKVGGGEFVAKPFHS